jgi:hypothetical protein
VPPPKKTADPPPPLTIVAHSTRGGTPPPRRTPAPPAPLLQALLGPLNWGGVGSRWGLMLGKAEGRGPSGMLMGSQNTSCHQWVRHTLHESTVQLEMLVAASSDKAVPQPAATDATPFKLIQHCRCCVCPAVTASLHYCCCYPHRCCCCCCCPFPACSPSTLEETVAQVLGSTSMVGSMDEEAIESQLPAVTTGV